jgi:hypothetical protein
MYNFLLTNDERKYMKKLSIDDSIYYSNILFMIRLEILKWIYTEKTNNKNILYNKCKIYF